MALRLRPRLLRWPSRWWPRPVSFRPSARSQDPCCRLPILASSTRRAAIGAMLIIGAVLAGYVYFVSLYLQRVEGFSPLRTGLALVPATATVVLTSTLVTRRLLARFGTKRVFVAGLVSMAVGQLLFSQISAGASYVTAVLPGLLFTALGIGLALPTASIAITAGVKSSDQGLAGALFTTSQQTGAAVGLAVLATVAAARTEQASGSLVAGYRLSFLIATGMAVAAAVLVAFRVSSGASEGPVGRPQPSQDAVPAATPPGAQLRKR